MNVFRHFKKAKILDFPIFPCQNFTFPQNLIQNGPRSNFVHSQIYQFENLGQNIATSSKAKLRPSTSSPSSIFSLTVRVLNFYCRCFLFHSSVIPLSSFLPWQWKQIPEGTNLNSRQRVALSSLTVSTSVPDSKTQWFHIVSLTFGNQLWLKRFPGQLVKTE